jgi:hypothetical protein
MKADEIAIADVLKHPKFGLVSFQPDVQHDTSYEDGMIRVRGLEGEAFFVDVEDCIEPSGEEFHYFWDDIKW